VPADVLHAPAGRARACEPGPRAQSGDAGGEAQAAARLFRPRDGVDDPRDAVAGQTGRARPVPRPMILRLLSEWLSQWAAEVGSLSWLAVALVAAIIEVSVPHFGCAFISAGAVAAAA